MHYTPLELLDALLVVPALGTAKLQPCDLTQHACMRFRLRVVTPCGIGTHRLGEVEGFA